MQSKFAQKYNIFDRKGIVYDITSKNKFSKKEEKSLFSTIFFSTLPIYFKKKG
jgi:hypothetical protein